MSGYPDTEDYVKCFELYGSNMNEIYKDTEDDKYELLFERIIRLLVMSSPFNLEIPSPFKVTARKFLDGDEHMRETMSVPEKRNFMLSDLYDFVLLHHKIKQRKM